MMVDRGPQNVLKLRLSIDYNIGTYYVPPTYTFMMLLLVYYVQSFCASVSKLLLFRQQGKSYFWYPVLTRKNASTIFLALSSTHH